MRFDFKGESNLLNNQENYKKERYYSDDEKLINRRNFLKVMAGAGLALAGHKGCEILKNCEDEDDSNEDYRPIMEIVKYDKEEKIEFGMEQVEKIKNYWKNRYQEDADMRISLQNAYRDMGEWKEYLITEFKNVGFTEDEAEKYIYLAIPESHWQFDVKSPAGAVGPYQFMPKTARLFGLKSGKYDDENPNVDERRDPIKSSNACAKHLMDIYHKTGDMQVALSGYNGSFVWKYIKDGGRDYAGFVKYMEKKINETRDEVKQNDFINYIIKKGETLSEICKHLGCSTQKILKYNNIPDTNAIYAGQEIMIPVDERDKETIYEQRIKGLAENMVYPAKFDAVWELIEGGFVKTENPGIEFKTMEVKNEIADLHTVKRGDTLWRLAFNYDVTKEEIKSANSLTEDKIKIGQKIKIPKQNQINTLQIASINLGVDLELLRGLNPSVIDSTRALPEGYEIRY